MKPLFVIIPLVLVLLVLGLFSGNAQQVTTTAVVTTNTVFATAVLTGANAANWGTQFAAITNLNGTAIYTVNALTNAFGLPGVTRTLTITVANNPQGGTNLYTVTISSQ